jgi:hypothetical protein
MYLTCVVTVYHVLIPVPSWHAFRNLVESRVSFVSNVSESSYMEATPPPNNPHPLKS